MITSTPREKNDYDLRQNGTQIWSEIKPSPTIRLATNEKPTRKKQARLSTDQ